MNGKTKQVQVRLPPALHSQLKGILALHGRKLVDFFNEAATAYVSNPQEYETLIAKINGGQDNVRNKSDCNSGRENL